jgi:BCD family chlorophyll transporter-like MFS transporter
MAFTLAAHWLSDGHDANRLAAWGVLAGICAFVAVIFAEPLDSPFLFRIGTVLIGFGGGLFAVGTLSAAMGLEGHGMNGLVLGAWGAVQATCAGAAIALGGALRDVVSHAATAGWLGEALQSPATGYAAVYHLELAMLFATLIVLGPLVRRGPAAQQTASSQRFGLAELPS